MNYTIIVYRPSAGGFESDHIVIVGRVLGEIVEAVGNIMFGDLVNKSDHPHARQFTIMTDGEFSGDRTHRKIIDSAFAYALNKYEDHMEALEQAKRDRPLYLHIRDHHNGQ